MKNKESRTLVEFTQSYRDGIKITKRGLSASPMICQKYGLKPGKVAVFTSSMGGRKAMSVFHFHPSCSLKKRHAYMLKHRNGAREVARQLKAGVAENHPGLQRAQQSLSLWWRELASEARALKVDLATSLGMAPSPAVVRVASSKSFVGH